MVGAALPTFSEYDLMLLPITGLYAALLGLLIIVLLLRIVAKRWKHRVGVGDGGEKTLLLAIRAHGNAIETIPIALILLAALELNKGSALTLHIFGAALLLGRIAHAFGISRTAKVNPGRFIGTVLTVTVIIGLAVANLLAFWMSRA